MLGDAIADSCSAVLARRIDTTRLVLRVAGRDASNSRADIDAQRRMLVALTSNLEFPDTLQIPFALRADSLRARGADRLVAPIVLPFDAVVDFNVTRGRIIRATIVFPSILPIVHGRLLDAAVRADSLTLLAGIGDSAPVTVRIGIALQDPEHSSGSAIKHFTLLSPHAAVGAVRSSEAPRLRYPDMLQNMGVEGEVTATFVIGVDGKPVGDVVLIRGMTDRGFVDPVLKAIRHLVYEPAVTEGCPVPFLALQPFEFRLR